jgi:hypothetical protein
MELMMAQQMANLKALDLDGKEDGIDNGSLD